MKVQLGSGKRYLKGWVNVDLWAPKADVREDIRSVWFEPGTVDKVLAVHVLEHVTQEECEALCRRAFGWLKAPGLLAVEMPDRAKCLKLCTGESVRAWDKGIMRGLGGLMADRVSQRVDWIRWLLENQRRIIRAADRNEDLSELVPERFYDPAEIHRHLWTESEFSDMLRSLGFCVESQEPEWHGPRPHRDMRVVGYKD